MSIWEKIGALLQEDYFLNRFSKKSYNIKLLFKIHFSANIMKASTCLHKSIYIINIGC